MKTIFKVKNQIRDFIRKFEEILFPILKFAWCYLVFHSVHTMFNYSEIFDRQIVILLLSVMCAMLPDGFLVFFSGVVIGFNCFTINLEVGLSYLLLFLLMYCMYLRFFPKYSFVLFLVPLCYMINMPWLAPIVVAVFAGIGGAVPAALGVVLYEFSIHTRDIAHMLAVAEKEDEVEVLKYYIEHILKNKELLAVMLVFMLTVVVTSALHKLSFPFSWYAAIVAGGLLCMLFYLLISKALSITPNMSSCTAGSLIGILVGCVVQMVKGVLDYPKTQRVQFEDDDYYYYVKAVPKLDKPEKKKAVQSEKRQLPIPIRTPLTPEEKARRLAAAGLDEEGRPKRTPRPEEDGLDENMSRNPNERPRRPMREELDEEGRPRRPMREGGRPGETDTLNERPRRPVREGGRPGETDTLNERPRRPMRNEMDEEGRPRRPMRNELDEEGRPRRPMRNELDEEGRPRRPMRNELDEEGRPRRPMRNELDEEGRPRRPMRNEPDEEGRPRRPMRNEMDEEGRPRRPIRNEREDGDRRPKAPEDRMREERNDKEAEQLLDRAKHSKDKPADLSDIEDEG